MDDPFKAIENRARLQEMYRRVFESPEGREVLTHLGKVAGVCETSFSVGTTDRETCFKEGKRHLILSVIRFIERDDLTYVAELMRRTHEIQTRTSEPGR